MKSHKKTLPRNVIVLVLLMQLVYLLVAVSRTERREDLNTALIAAIKKDEARLAISELRDGADANAREWPPDRRSGLRKLWSDLFSNQAATGDAPMALFVALGDDGGMRTNPIADVKLVKALLDAGASANATDVAGRTPLMLAVIDGSPELVRVLLEHNAEVNSQDGFRETAMFFASRGADSSIVQLLISRGAQINVPDFSGREPLSVAAQRGSDTTVKLLLDTGADVNARDLVGSTALDYALNAERVSCAKLLIARGARKFENERAGKDIRRPSRGHPEVARSRKMAGQLPAHFH